MPALFLQIVTIVSDLMIFVFVGFYLKTLQHDKQVAENEKKSFVEKQEKLTQEYQKIVDSAHQEEKKILENATQKAAAILSKTQLVADTSKELIDKALQNMIAAVEKEAASSSENSLITYKNYLNQLAGRSLANFENLTKKLEEDMDKEMKDFRASLLPKVQKDLDTYRDRRFKDADKSINLIIQRVSQTVLNKSLSGEDHKNLIIESLEKSRKAGILE